MQATKHIDRSRVLHLSVSDCGKKHGPTIDSQHFGTVPAAGAGGEKRQSREGVEGTKSTVPLRRGDMRSGSGRR